jgi:hypothetical protein
MNSAEPMIAKRALLGGLARTVCACVLTMSVVATWAADLPRIEAIWKQQRIVFVYGSVGRYYPCSTLEYKIKMILRRLGAREQLEVRRYACRDLAAQARFEVLIESPVEATLDNIRNLTRYSSEEELIARARGVQLPSASELQRFPAAWESISFHRDRHLHLDSGDCALVQQLRRQIMPNMAIQVTKDINSVDCSEARESLSAPRLSVLALVPTSVSGQGSP